MARTMSIGARIKARREELQLTQQGLAERVSAARGKATHQADVSNWEAGRSVPSTGILAPLASALEESADWLLTGKRPAPIASEDAA